MTFVYTPSLATLPPAKVPSAKRTVLACAALALVGLGALQSPEVREVLAGLLAAMLAWAGALLLLAVFSRSPREG